MPLATLRVGGRHPPCQPRDVVGHVVFGVGAVEQERNRQFPWLMSDILDRRHALRHLAGARLPLRLVEGLERRRVEMGFEEVAATIAPLDTRALDLAPGAIEGHEAHYGPPAAAATPVGS